MARARHHPARPPAGDDDGAAGTGEGAASAGYRFGTPTRRRPRIVDLGADERPREKLLTHGAGSLGNAELIALLLRTGLAGQNVVEMSRDLLDAHGGTLAGLARATTDSLQSVPGVGPAKAAELAAVFELASRIARERVERACLDCPEAVYEFVGPAMSSLDREVVRVLLVNARQRHLRSEDVSVGAIDQAIAHPQLILKPVIASAAHGFFLIHNHPSGDPSPSAADRALTRNLGELCERLEVRFIDHVIVGSSNEGHVEEPYFSFREAGLL